ncbi:MAG: hypothetical protein WC770_02355 [Phycisphaerae bacterium]|jgi:hypothetical protein
MKTRLKMTMFFLAGCLIGTVVGGGLIAWQYTKLFKREYLVQVVDQANIVRDIYAGKSKEFADSIVRILPQYVIALNKMYGKDEKKLPALWLIKRVYKENSIPVPEEISAILNSLPPKPLSPCELRRIKSAESNEPNTKQLQ